jgi:hypothetical protein
MVWRGDEVPKTSEAGFDAVRKVHGPEMVQRIRNWPRLAEVYCLAQNGDEPMVQVDVEKATRDMERARSDRDFALDQAERIARKFPRMEWEIVPSVAQLRREWGMDEPIGMVRLTKLPPVKRPSVLPRPPIEVNEEEVRLRRQQAAEAAARLKVVMGPHARGPS